MKLYLLAVAGLLALACTNPGKEAQPVVDRYLSGRISSPETYKPVRLDYLGEGEVDLDFYRPDLDGPSGDSVVVRVFRQSFRHLNRTGDPVETAWCLYLNEDLNAVLCASGGEEPMEGIRWTRRR
jgi:hypothetical protein